MLRLACQSALVLVLLAVTGCATRSAADSPAKTATACGPGKGDSRTETDCLRQILGDLADLDPNVVGASPTPRVKVGAKRYSARETHVDARTE